MRGGKGSEELEAPKAKKPRRTDTPDSAHHLTIGAICRHGVCAPKAATNYWLRNAELQARIGRAVDAEVRDFMLTHPIRAAPPGALAPENDGATQPPAPTTPGAKAPAAPAAPAVPSPPKKGDDWL